jgi:hypothetical protein
MAAVGPEGTEREKNKLTRGTPTKITLFRADSRMRAAVVTASEILCGVAPGGSEPVTKRYKCPTDDGRFVVSRVHVCAKASIATKSNY